MAERKDYSRVENLGQKKEYQKVGSSDCLKGTNWEWTKASMKASRRVQKMDSTKAKSSVGLMVDLKGSLTDCHSEMMTDYHSVGPKA